MVQARYILYARSLQCHALIFPFPKIPRVIVAWWVSPKCQVLQSLNSHAIYFMREINTKSVKIGHAADPQGRRYNIQINSPYVIVVDFLHPTLVADAEYLENQLHQDCKSSKICGEWFELPINVDYQNIINNAEHKLNIRLARRREVDE